MRNTIIVIVTFIQLYSLLFGQTTSSNQVDIIVTKSGDIFLCKITYVSEFYTISILNSQVEPVQFANDKLQRVIGGKNRTVFILDGIYLEDNGLSISEVEYNSLVQQGFAQNNKIAYSIFEDGTIVIIAGVFVLVYMLYQILKDLEVGPDLSSLKL